ncbi:O-antigen ligase family protein [Erwinia rhapontici]|uniref:O-antigen ligase family protein n=1 Tax=Erwinia rhapontici TaxID=55212 RepID=UPI003BA2DC1A
MKVDLYKANLVTKLINVVLVLLCVSLSFNLITYGISQKVFYFSGYLSIGLTLLGVANKDARSRVSKLGFFLIFSLALIALIRLAWVGYLNYHHYELSSNALGIIQNYLLGGKRLLLGVFVIAAIMMFGNRISFKVVGYSKAIIFLGMFLTLISGVYEHYLVTHNRIKLTADAASSASYMVIFIYCCYLWLRRFTCQPVWKTIDFLFVVTSLFVLVLCGTRITYLAFIFISTYYAISVLGWKNIISSWKSIVLAVVFFVSLFFFTQQRWVQAINNIESYNANSSTSVGARFAIWQGGLHFIDGRYGFSSPDERTVSAHGYIHEVQPKNVIAYTNVKYNLHNEFLEVTSLQGIAGFLSLLLLFSVGFVALLKPSLYKGFYLPIASLFITGLTDSVLIYGPTVMIFAIAMAICSLRIDDTLEKMQN